MLGGRVERVEELVEVDGGGGEVLGEDAAVGDLRGALGRQGEVDVAVGDARQRRLADDRLRPVPQRRVVLVDGHHHLRLSVRREVDALDLADGLPRHLDEVALDQLRGVLEVRLDGVATATAAEQQEGSEDHRGQYGQQSDHPHNGCGGPQLPPRTVV